MSGVVLERLVQEVVALRSRVASLERLEKLPALSTLGLGWNLVPNHDFESWSTGTSSAPDGWSLTGTGAAVARVAGLGSPYAAQVTYGSAAAVLSPASGQLLPVGFVKGQTLTLMARVKCSTASIARLALTDNVGTTYSGYHAGDGNEAWLSLTRTIDASATSWNVQLRVEGTGSAIFDRVMLMFGAVPQLPVPRMFAPICLATYLSTSVNNTTYSGTPGTNINIDLNVSNLDGGFGGYVRWAWVRVAAKSAATDGFLCMGMSSGVRNRGVKIWMPVAGKWDEDSGWVPVYSGIIYGQAYRGSADITNAYVEIMGWAL